MNSPSTLFWLNRSGFTSERSVWHRQPVVSTSIENGIKPNVIGIIKLAGAITTVSNIPLHNPLFAMNMSHGKSIGQKGMGSSKILHANTENGSALQRFYLGSAMQDELAFYSSMYHFELIHAIPSLKHKVKPKRTSWEFFFPYAHYGNARTGPLCKSFQTWVDEEHCEW